MSKKGPSIAQTLKCHEDERHELGVIIFLTDAIIVNAVSATQQQEVRARESEYEYLLHDARTMEDSTGLDGPFNSDLQ